MTIKKRLQDRKNVCIKFLLKLVFVAAVLAGIILGLLLARPTSAQAPTIENQDYTSDDIIIKDNAIQQPPITPPGLPIPSKRTNQSFTKSESGRHSTRAEKQISDDLQAVERLRLFLSGIHSPLADYATQISQSPYYSTIIGLCWIEQYHCTHAPYFNYWGIGPGKRYSSMEQGIAAIDSLLAKYEVNGHDTIEELNCYYVQPCSQNWLSTVLKVKTQLESL